MLPGQSMVDYELFNGRWAWRVNLALPLTICHLPVILKVFSVSSGILTPGSQKLTESFKLDAWLVTLVKQDMLKANVFHIPIIPILSLTFQSASFIL